jgi:hypothetical protein
MGPSLCHWQHYSHQADCGWDERKEEKIRFLLSKLITQEEMRKLKQNFTSLLLYGGFYIF